MITNFFIKTLQVFVMLKIFYASFLNIIFNKIDGSSILDKEDKSMKNNSLNSEDHLEDEEDEYDETDEDELKESDVEKALQLLLSEDWDDETVKALCRPTYILSLENDSGYFYSLNRKSYVLLKNKSVALPVDLGNLVKDSKKMLKNYYSINNEIFEIDSKYIVYLGWD